MRIMKWWQDFINGPDENTETEFLPAILEVTDTPPSPVGHMVMWSIILLLAVGLIWSFLGHIDETAVAEGKIIPSGQVKTVQVKNKGIIREIKVKEGDYVKEGDTLVILDPTTSNADYDSLKKRAAYFALDIKRLEAELSGQPFLPDNYDDLTVNDIQAERMLYESRQGQYRADYNAASALLTQKKAALQAAKEGYEKYRGMYAIATEKERRLQTLLEQNAIAEFQLLEHQSQRIELERNMYAQQDMLEQAQAEMDEAQHKLSSLDETYKRDVMTSLVEARKQYYAFEEEMKKAEEDAALTTIAAPCDGRVYNLSVHTLGGIVTDAQALMMIVPNDAELEFEVWADNKDIGFIRNGQEAEVKVQTYNFQKFGVVRATVEDISPDAASDEKDPTTYEKYRLRLKIQPDSWDIFGESFKLGPGMHVTAEVKIKQKRIIDYFLDPFRQYTSEALRER
ncbi:MAG: HlyD family type I secretion periplasmic adaptor subunit [Selenomonas sp.]|nr:HlyD family type I secretion periplasmic adaptor subunit [Selenomonas sp.]